MGSLNDVRNWGVTKEDIAVSSFDAYVLNGGKVNENPPSLADSFVGVEWKGATLQNGHSLRILPTHPWRL